MTEFSFAEMMYNLSMCCVPRARRVESVREKLGVLCLEKKHELHQISQRIVETSQKKNTCIDNKDRTGAVSAARELKRLKARETKVAGIMFKCEAMQEAISDMESVSGVVTAMNRANMLYDDDKLSKMSDLAHDVTSRQDDAFADIEGICSTIAGDPENDPEFEDELAEIDREISSAAKARSLPVSTPPSLTSTSTTSLPSIPDSSSKVTNSSDNQENNKTHSIMQAA